LAREPATDIPLSRAREQIGNALRAQQRTARLRALVDEALAKADLKIDEAGLATISVPADAPIREPDRPLPGFLPMPAAADGGSPR
jgi:hypothetical protein